MHFKLENNLNFLVMLMNSVKNLTLNLYIIIKPIPTIARQSVQNLKYEIII